MKRIIVLLVSAVLVLLLTSCGDEVQGSENVLSKAETDPAVHEQYRVMFDYPSSWNRNDARYTVRVYPEKQEDIVKIALGGSETPTCDDVKERGIEKWIQCEVEQGYAPVNGFKDVSTRTIETKHFSFHIIETYREPTNRKYIVAYAMTTTTNGNRVVVRLELQGVPEMVEKHQVTFEAIIETLRPS